MSPALVVPWVLSTIITDKPVLQSALTKRPYSEKDEKGGLLVNVDDSVVEPKIRLSFEDKTLIDWKDVSHGVSMHSFSIDGQASLLPSLGWGFKSSYSMELNVTLHGRRFDGLVRIDQTLQLMRTRTPSRGSFSQVDFRTGGLLVNSKPFYVIGLYTGDSNETNVSPADWDDPVISGPGEEQKLADEIKRNSEHGLTSILIYHFNDLPEDMQERLLDVCWTAGLFLIYPLHVFLKSIMKDETTADSAWNNVEPIIERWKNHPAILGWYVCDDCTTSWARVSKGAMDIVYKHIKQIDPSHVVFGAIESQQLDIFTKRSDYSQGVSLDVLMFENYVSRNEANSHMGTLEDPGLDGSLRKGNKLSDPLPFEALVNCPGPYQLAKGFDPHLLPEEDQASIVYSLSWLAVITANIPHQLYFRRKYVDNTLLSAAVGRYATEIHQLSSYVNTSYPGVRRLRVELSEHSRDNFRAALLPNSGEDKCALLVVTRLNSVPNEASLQFAAEFDKEFVKNYTEVTRLRDNYRIDEELRYQALVDRIETRWGTELYKLCKPRESGNQSRCGRDKHVFLPVMLFTTVISSVTLFAGYFGFQIWKTKQSRASNERALEMCKQSWTHTPY